MNLRVDCWAVQRDGETLVSLVSGKAVFSKERMASYLFEQNTVELARSIAAATGGKLIPVTIYFGSPESEETPNLESKVENKGKGEKVKGKKKC